MGSYPHIHRLVHPLPGPYPLLPPPDLDKEGRVDNQRDTPPNTRLTVQPIRATSGIAARNEKAEHGCSRDHRPDCKQVVIGLVLDGEGFPKAHEVFTGNTKDENSMARMLSIAWTAAPVAPPGGRVSRR